MPHSQSFDAIVLKTYDVGEADRLCVLFTRERGRLLARASGARRLNSKLGGSLLPFSHLTVELKEGSAGWIVCGVSGERGEWKQRISQFAALEEGIELLLRLVTDEGTLPDVFDATLTFMDACRADHEHAVLGYSFCLLHALGFLPGEEEMANFQELNPAEHAYIRTCRLGELTQPDSSCNVGQLNALRLFILEEQLLSPLKAGDVVLAMR